MHCSRYEIMKLRGEHFARPLFATFTLVVGILCVTGILCGPTGNCYSWVFEIRSGHAKKVLESGGVDLDASRYDDGIRKIVVRQNGSSYPDSLYEYRYSSSRYQLVGCFQQDKQTLKRWRESCEGVEDAESLNNRNRRALGISRLRGQARLPDLRTLLTFL